jgi:penicillin-binding protein 1A
LGGRTFSRKLLEAMVALRIEREFTKQQILELYVNRIYFGAGCYGVETASQAYFGKNASKLNLSEAALLAGLIRSPNRFSPL